MFRNYNMNSFLSPTNFQLFRFVTDLLDLSRSDISTILILVSTNVDISSERIYYRISPVTIFSGIKLISLSASSQEQILGLQVRHRTRTWRHGKWCGTCRTVIDWRGLRTVEASCSEWYPGVGTPIRTGGRNSKRWEGIWPSFSRTIWTDITWTSRVSHPNAPIEPIRFDSKRESLGNYLSSISTIDRGRRAWIYIDID